MPESVLEAIQQGVWDFEPEEQDSNDLDPTNALPGTDQKLSVLAIRLEKGMPLWHPEDRRYYDDAD